MQNAGFQTLLSWQTVISFQLLSVVNTYQYLKYLFFIVKQNKLPNWDLPKDSLRITNSS